MSKAYVQITRHSVSVETWVSSATSSDESSLQDPFPAGIRHNIKVYWTAGYTTDFEVHGLVAAVHPQLRFDLAGEPATWSKPVNSVAKDGDESCGMKVDKGTVTARVQCTSVRFKSAWGGWVTALATPLEVQVAVS